MCTVTNIDEQIREIQKRIAEAIAAGEMKLAAAIYNSEFVSAQEEAEKLWECR